MDPTAVATQAVLTPWAQYGIIGSVVVALGTAVVFLIFWIRSLVREEREARQKEIERLEGVIATKDADYTRLVDSIRKRTKEEA